MLKNFIQRQQFGYFRVFAWCMKSSAIFSSCAACTNATAKPSHGASAFFANINEIDVNRTNMARLSAKLFSLVKISFACMRIKNSFHINGFALSHTNQKRRNILNEKLKNKDENLQCKITYYKLMKYFNLLSTLFSFHY